MEIFRLATAGDGKRIVSLFMQAIAHMRDSGIEQWDEQYPTEAVLRRDIGNGEMYVLEREAEILSAVVMNESCDAEYAAGAWRFSKPYAVIHRLCVHPSCQRQGIAGKTMSHTERLAGQRGYKSVRLDAFTLNPYALRLYERLGYRQAGEVLFRKGRFVLMEKGLTAD